jgi:hypothetical protein
LSKTLDDFLKTYIKNREIKNGALSYQGYLRSKGNSYSTDYKGERLRATLDYKSALPKRGTGLEALGEAGLRNSGYAEHLMSLADKRHRSELASIERKYASEESEAKRGYASYLAEYDTAQTKLKDKITDTLIKNGVLDENEGYVYAIESGLAPEAAAVAGSRASAEVRRRLRLKVISEMFNRHIPPDSAADYALELGLSEEDALDIKSIADKYKHNTESFSQEYLEYLESLGNKTTATYG